MSKNKKQKFQQADLKPIKKLIKEKASDGDLSNQDIQDILKSTKDVYKETPLTEVDILKLYTTMVDELDSGVYGQRKVPVLLRIFGIIIAISWATMIPTILQSFSHINEMLQDASSVITGTTSILIIGYAVVLFLGVIFVVITGVLMLLNKRVWAGRFLYTAIALSFLELIIITSLEGVSENFLYTSIYIVIQIAISVYLHPKLYQERRFHRMLKDLDTEVRAKEGRLGLAVDQSKGYIELDFFNLFWIFVVGCVVGLLSEYVFHIIFVWGFDPQNWYDRAGLLFGPFSPIYGFGGLFMTLALNRFRNMQPVLLFVMCTLIGGAFEYFVSWFLEVSFGIEAWNYSGMFLSIGGGRTCLLFAAMFGVMGFVWIKWALPICMNLINKIPWKWRYPITVVAAIFMIVNCVMTLQSIDCWSQRQAGKVPVTPIEQFYEKNYDDEFMAKRFASMTFQQEKSSRNNIEDATN